MILQSTLHKGWESLMMHCSQKTAIDPPCTNCGPCENTGGGNKERKIPVTRYMELGTPVIWPSGPSTSHSATGIRSVLQQWLSNKCNPLERERRAKNTNFVIIRTCNGKGNLYCTLEWCIWWWFNENTVKAMRAYHGCKNQCQELVLQPRRTL